MFLWGLIRQVDHRHDPNELSLVNLTIIVHIALVNNHLDDQYLTNNFEINTNLDLFVCQWSPQIFCNFPEIFKCDMFAVGRE